MIILKREQKKQRKQMTVRFNRKITEPLTKLLYTISYYKRLVRTYEPVLNMNSRQYLKFLASNEKKSIDNRIELIRK